ncbi:MAG: ADP-ribose pyrophosphatase [Oscillospiraceae bacterium]|nr:ADP-ribose pyrophosphatase [Oscillospiraceae bacterium]
MDLTENTLESKLEYQGHIVTVRTDRVTLPNGGTATREVVSHPGGVAVVPLMEDGTVLMVRQYRYAFSQVLLEIPAGKLNPGEEPLPAAMRELEEEAGVVPEELIDLGAIYPSPGFCDETLYLYLAKGLTRTFCHPDDDEFLEVEAIPLDALIGQIMRNELSDAKSVAALLKTHLFLKE